MASARATSSGRAAVVCTSSTFGTGSAVRLTPSTVAPKPLSSRAVSRPIPPRPTTSTVCSATCFMVQRSGHSRRACSRQQPRQILCAGQHPEHGELRKRPAVHAGGGGEQHPLQFALGEAGGLDLTAAARCHGVHPAQVRIRPDGREPALPAARPGSRTAPRPCQQLIESRLLLGRSVVRRVARHGRRDTAWAATGRHRRAVRRRDRRR